MNPNLSLCPTWGADFLSLLSNAARLKILCRLSEGEWDVGALARDVGLSQSALSQHLKKLRDGRLVESRRDAQNIYYVCNHQGVEKMLQTLGAIMKQGSDRNAVHK
ncbi:transcriptional regulator [Metarhizobium album]|uniref:Transcriptional regulator n=1 Tax=Metarhizobium album TaxID=2182425 RepID=A0A2U2DHW9_9HYPH|nr:metalloregulator ArsR/SmtB family transcription factor [Rhizobium album]PWE52915.1 transcriptional regulator [Rhizobium album]